MTRRNAGAPTERVSKRGKAATAMAPMHPAVLGKFNDALRLWQICEQPVCRRRHRCSNDTYACFKRHWAAMPEEEKEYWRGAFKAGKTTRSAQDMHRAGLAARDACLNAQAQNEKPSVVTAVTQPAPAAPAPDARIRTL
jgi:hypothetical protein